MDDGLSWNRQSLVAEIKTDAQRTADHTGRAVFSQRVLEAIGTVPRQKFVPEGAQRNAYAARPLSIDHAQTISQPYIVALMTERLKLDDRCKVLEIGTGSGYQAAILARIARRVYTIERYRSLMAEAERRFRELKITNIVPRVADGGKGWTEQAPFDRIIVTAAAPFRPDALLEQLKPGGIMVAPVGAGEVQRLIRYQKDEEGAVSEEELTQVRFVPLREGVARSEDRR